MSAFGRWCRSLRGTLAIVAGATVVWERLVPLIDRHSTADPLDVLAYLLGGPIQHALVQLAGARQPDGASANARS